MSAAFTPGPWKKAKYIVSNEAGGFVAHTRPTGECRVGDEANARLIAAAPDLASWLKWALTLLPADVRRSGQYDMALATYTKATGSAV